MKVHGLDNTIPPPDDSRKIQKYIEQPSTAGAGAKITGKNGPPGDSVSARADSVERISRGRDVIELRVKRAVNSENGGFYRIDDIKGSVGHGERSPDVTYSIESISSAAREAYRVSREARIVKARQNIADGYYNSLGFIERLAEILIDRFYLSGEGE